MMDIHAILKQLPHRYPFLLVDRVLELQRNERILAIKNVTFNEPYFMGHFPGRPVMPGVLILGSLGELAGLLRREHDLAAGLAIQWIESRDHSRDQASA